MPRKINSTPKLNQKGKNGKLLTPEQSSMQNQNELSASDMGSITGGNTVFTSNNIFCPKCGAPAQVYLNGKFTCKCGHFWSI